MVVTSGEIPRDFSEWPVLRCTDLLCILPVAFWPPVQLRQFGVDVKVPSASPGRDFLVVKAQQSEKLLCKTNVHESRVASLVPQKLAA
jgi:hypothetical protein